MTPVQHVVLLKFKPDVSDEKAASLLADVLGLQQKIAGITECSGGVYSSPEGRNQGYTHGFVMTFESAAARDNYLPHPEHEVVKDELVANLESVIAFDYEISS